MSADPRVARTRAVLKQALMELLRRHDWGGISIVGLCRQAGIARSSFYEHFETKSDVLAEVFSEEVAGIPISDQTDAPLGTLVWLVDHARESPEFFARAMSGRRGDSLGQQFVLALSTRLGQELAARGVADPDAKAAYIIGGSIACMLAVKGEDIGVQLQIRAVQVLG